jgi:hypothetical protein
LKLLILLINAFVRFFDIELPPFRHRSEDIGLSLYLNEHPGQI